MPCRKGTKQTPQVIIDEILREHQNGVRVKELSVKYDKPFRTIKDMITRENNKKINFKKGILPKKVGRPRKTFLTLEEENARLKMENELLKSFLKELERGWSLALNIKLSIKTGINIPLNQCVNSFVYHAADTMILLKG